MITIERDFTNNIGGDGFKVKASDKGFGGWRVKGLTRGNGA